MILIRKTLLASVYLSASLISLSVSANCNSTICNGTIEQLFIQDGRLLIATSGDERSLNCDAVSQRYMSVSRNDPNYDPYFSALLAAQRAGVRIDIRIVDDSPSCEVGYVISR